MERSRIENAALLAIPLVPTAYIVITAVSSIPNLRFALMILIGVSILAMLVGVTPVVQPETEGGLRHGALSCRILAIFSMVCCSCPLEPISAIAPRPQRAREGYS